MTCGAHLYIGDDHGDNHATMKCQLEEGHEGRHSETWLEGTCQVLWENDEREETGRETGSG